MIKAIAFTTLFAAALTAVGMSPTPPGATAGPSPAFDVLAVNSQCVTAPWSTTDVAETRSEGGLHVEILSAGCEEGAVECVLNLCCCEWMCNIDEDNPCCDTPCCDQTCVATCVPIEECCHAGE